MFTLGEIASATAGTAYGQTESIVTAVVTDSRVLQPGELFIALRGEHFDGHAFIPSILGVAGGIVADREWAANIILPERSNLVVVDNTLSALGTLAGAYRKRFTLPVVAVTGSNGKTTVKEMLAAILRQEGDCLATEGNLNNLIGLPRMLFRLTGEHRFAVLEMGMSEPGEIDRLAEITSPMTGIITNANPAHLESMKNVDRVAEAKGELFLRLPKQGWAVCNRDDARISLLPVPVGVQRISYGLTAGEVHAEKSTLEGASGQRFRLVLPDGAADAFLGVPGSHNLSNALAAAAGAWTLGVSAERIVSGLASYRPYKQRFNILTQGWGTIVDDTYNANPASMVAALSTLAECAGGALKIAVLGEMRELGADERILHREVGAHAGALVDRLIVLGDLGLEIAVGARAAGMPAGAVTIAESHDDAVQQVLAKIPKGTWVLVKGSRGMAMEKVVTGIINSDAGLSEGRG